MLVSNPLFQILNWICLAVIFHNNNDVEQVLAFEGKVFIQTSYFHFPPFSLSTFYHISCFSNFTTIFTSWNCIEKAIMLRYLISNRSIQLIECYVIPVLLSWPICLHWNEQNQNTWCAILIYKYCIFKQHQMAHELYIYPKPVTSMTFYTHLCLNT